MNIVILSSGNVFGGRLLQKLNKHRIKPTLVLKENLKRSFIERFRNRGRKYGAGTAILWFYDVMKSYFSQFSIKKARKENKNTYEIVEVQTVNSEEAIQLLRSAKPDIIINTVSSILSKSILKIPKFGVFGVHPGWLPKYAGLSSIHWQVIDGLTPGFTIFQLTDKIDRGQIFHRQKVLPLPGERFDTYGKRFEEILTDSFTKFITSIHQGLVPKALEIKNIQYANRGLKTLSSLPLFKRNWEMMTKIKRKDEV